MQNAKVMGKRRKFIIHPGYPKTATTTLQKALFARHPDLCYLGKPLKGAILEIELDIIKLDDPSFSSALPGLQKKIDSVIEDCNQDNRNILLSHEGFLRPTRYEGHDIRRTADRIWKVFGEPFQGDFDCHVLLTLRNQVDIVPSYFFDSVSRRPGQFRQFIAQSLQKPGEGYTGSLFYDDMVHHYADLFGRDQVKIMLFEQFIQHREAFLRDLADFLGVDHATSKQLIGDNIYNTKARTGSGYRITANEIMLDVVNKVFPNTERLPYLLRYPLKRIPLKTRAFSLSSTEKSAIQQLYVGGNRRLSDEFGLPMGEYDYY